MRHDLHLPWSRIVHVHHDALHALFRSSRNQVTGFSIFAPAATMKVRLDAVGSSLA
jgi:hypothetical protein